MIKNVLNKVGFVRIALVASGRISFNSGIERICSKPGAVANAGTTSARGCCPDSGRGGSRARDRDWFETFPRPKRSARTRCLSQPRLD
jgi:hypothetical protein